MAVRTLVGGASVVLFAGAACWMGIKGCRKLYGVLRGWRREALFGDIYREILLRLPADRPRLLHRFAVVCWTWRTILAEPAFLRSYRIFHGLPRMLGYVYDGGARNLLVARFVSTDDDPTFLPRVPKEGVNLHVLDSRHGRVIFKMLGEGLWIEESTLIIWDPVADHHEELRRPEPFRKSEFDNTATILCDTTGCDHVDCHGGPFCVVYLCIQGASTSAFNYTSSSGTWTASPAAPAAIADEDDWGFPMPAPTTMVGATTLYFRSPRRVLRYRFGDEVEDLLYIDIPPFISHNQEAARGTALMPAADGRLGFAAMCSDCTVRLWETEVSADGAVDWVLTQTALVIIPSVPGVRLIGGASSSLFLRTKEDDVIRVDVGNGRWEMLPKPAAQISGLVTFMSYGIP